MQLPRALDFPKQLVQQVIDDEVPELAAGLAYRFLFAIFPFGIFLAALAAFVAAWFGVGDPTNDILSALDDNLPSEVAAGIAPQLQEVLGRARPELLSIGAIAALWAATSGVSSLINAMNKTYDVEETRSFFAKTALAAGLTMVGSAGILIAFVTIVGGSVLTEQAIDALGIGPGTWQALSLLRFPLVLLLVAIAVGLLFRFGPNVAVSFRWTLTGGAVFAVGWLTATVVFGLYVANFGSYANTYGALGGVVILMLWFYLTAFLLLLAAEVTAILAKRREPERVQARQQETATTAEAKEMAKRAAQRAGRGVGVLAGVAESATGAADTDSKAARDATPVPSSVTTSVASSDPSPVRRVPRSEPGPTTEFRPSRVFAVIVLAAGAVAGAVAGLLAADDDEGAARG
ncbi:MAG TPA: YihY/virulence factor BrkB family protein [Candidatus Limnocylindrales bacterium]|nr:YihY/virulence factor BrkB family protein [Candidatus Limnocylindrales bacterium]